jgi:hypothetical protein
MSTHEAMLYEKKDDKKVKCNLCARRCLISEGGDRLLPGAEE